ncbi:hypothetical protein DPMN_035663 [Dreissena polymorpha]|uniref:Uncharacterized protein n=1 Tax=Dreissena polymorpha TaxID=45954 RepID=A0A9D4RN48_DREPO|nr:hypothetical protein DPMN_035663 [Dreissena polymorpha]
MYSVLETNLMDRIKGRVDADATVGNETIFTMDEEKKLYDHVTCMAEIGFGYKNYLVQYIGRVFGKSKET